MACQGQDLGMAVSPPTIRVWGLRPQDDTAIETQRQNNTFLYIRIHQIKETLTGEKHNHERYEPYLEVGKINLCL